MSKRVVVNGLAAGALAVAAIGLPAKSASANDWTVSLGAEGRVLPSFLGSDRYIFAPFPVIDIRRAGTPARFHSPRDGASLGLIESNSFRFGPTVKIDLPRRESDDDDLRGLDNVDWAVEVGLFAEYWPLPWLRTRAEVRQGFGGHHGVVADLTADAVVPVTSQLTWSLGPRVTLVTADANDPYFSIDAVQSAKSGLPVYEAGGGVQSFGFGTQARYQLTPKWETHVFLEYAHLSGDAADSPLVQQRGSADQVQVGIGASYAFDVPGLW